MKELTIEQKAKRYDEAIRESGKIIDFCTGGANIPECVSVKATIEHIFPELTESEDEKIRKAIIEFFELQDDNTTYSLIPKKDIIAWLEKQRGQKTVDEIAKEVCKNRASATTFLKSAGIMNEKGELAEQYRQDGQNPADNVELKFNVGDWITNGKFIVGQIISVDKEYYHYICNGIEQPLYISNAHNYHLWAIQDAKDGDVLFTSSTASHETFIFKSIDERGNVKCYFAYDSEDGFREGKYHFIGKPTFMTHPATKEQRDLLFQKMHEAGYKWDAEKKELKKIEKIAAWSEKDKEMSRFIGNAITADDSSVYLKSKGIEVIDAHVWLDELKDRVQPQPKQEWSEDDEKIWKEISDMLWEGYTQSCSNFTWDDIRDWVNPKIKSIRSQNAWKPSDEQIKAVRLARAFVMDNFDDNPTLSEILIELEKQLKKLREK